MDYEANKEAQYAFFIILQDYFKDIREAREKGISWAEIKGALKAELTERGLWRCEFEAMEPMVFYKCARKIKESRFRKED